MSMKRLIALLLTLCCLLPLAAPAEEGAVIDRTGNLTEEYVFPEGTPILEIIFPRVYSSDCAIIRYGDETMMIDASTRNKAMIGRIQTAMAAAGVDHIDVAFNSHPHDDHIDGFQFVHAYAPIGKLLIAFPEDYDARMKSAVRFMNENGIPIERVADGDVLTLGENGEVTMTVIQRQGTKAWGTNDQSAMLLIRFGERTILFAGDVENRAQRDYGENPPDCGLKADILKQPHHGQQPLQDVFWEQVQPEMVFMNGAADVMNGGKKYYDKRGVPYILGYKGLTRMRTDGQVWVIDYIYEAGADRETIQPEYR